MWHLTTCKISGSFSFLNWIKHELIFYRISELMLATLIQRYDKNHFISRTREPLIQIQLHITNISSIRLGCLPY